MYHYRMRKGSIIHTDAAINRYDYFLSCIDSMDMIESTIKGEKDINIRNAYVNKSAVYACKIISRKEKEAIKRAEAINLILKKLEDYPLPPRKYMKPKTWLRANLLRKYPIFFSILMRCVHVFDIDSRHRIAHMYD